MKLCLPKMELPESTTKYFKHVLLSFSFVFSFFFLVSLFLPLSLSPLPLPLYWYPNHQLVSSLASACRVYLVIFGRVCTIFYAQLRVVAQLLLTPSSPTLYLAPRSLDNTKTHEELLLATSDLFHCPLLCKHTYLQTGKHTHVSILIYMHIRMQTHSHTQRWTQIHTFKHRQTHLSTHTHTVIIVQSHSI